MSAPNEVLSVPRRPTSDMHGLQKLCRLGYGSMLAGFRKGKYPGILEPDERLNGSSRWVIKQYFVY